MIELTIFKPGQPYLRTLLSGREHKVSEVVEAIFQVMKLTSGDAAFMVSDSKTGGATIIPAEVLRTHVLTVKEVNE